MAPSPRRLSLLVLAVSFVMFSIFSCGGKGGTVPMGTSAARPLDWAKNMHPRLLLTSGEQARIKSALETTHKFLWERYLQDLPARLEAAKKPFGDEMDRGQADLAPDLAFAWLMTGSPEHFQAARDYILRLAGSPVWDPSNDLIHGHLLQGLALSYDFLYQSLAPTERDSVASRLGRECEAEYQRMTTKRVWYRNEYFQNHAHSNFCGLAYAACALYGENPAAGKWLDLCEAFYDSCFQVMPPDGGSLEGLSYGSYSLEYILRYAELAKSLLGHDYYPQSEYLKHSSEFLLHSTLPVMQPAEWAMTFGDAPRHSNWHGPEPQLFLLAQRYHDPAAQWLGRKLIELEPSGLASAGWWALLWYDPAAPEAGPASFPTLHHFTELDQVMLRSSWTDPRATLIGLKSGPFMGRIQSKLTSYDWGTGHQHPDAGSFQIFSHGQFLAIDPLYTAFKRAANHNTLMVKGRGQLGDEVQWFGASEALKFGQYPTILQADSFPGYDYVVADVAPAYHPSLGLRQFIRHYLFIKPDILLVADQVKLDDKGIFYAWPAEDLATGGGLDHNSAGYVVGPQGEAWTTFDGPDGDYCLYCMYLDNYPGQGKYSFKVGDKTVHEWTCTETITDSHLELAPPVALKNGDRIAFQAQPMGAETRLLKLVAYSPNVPARREVEWLMHLDPEAEVSIVSNILTARQGGAALELRVLTPLAKDIYCEHWQVKGAEVEAFTYRQTRRVVVTPEFSGDSCLILTMIRTSAADGPKNSAVIASSSGLSYHIAWELDKARRSLDWDLAARKVKLE